MTNNNERNYLIFYHKEDNDGVWSAAMMYKHLNCTLNIDKDNIHLEGLDYNDVSRYTKEDFNKLRSEYTDIILTDISFPIQLMEYMWQLWGKSMVWVDHHAPRINEVLNSKIIPGDLPGVRETNRSAILCMWKYLYDPFDITWNEDHERIPLFLRVLSAYDSWTYEQEGFDFEYVKCVNEGVNWIWNLDMEHIIGYFPYNVNETCYYDHGTFHGDTEYANEIGRILFRNDAQRMENVMTYNADKTWVVDDEDNYKMRKAAAITLSGKSSSDMFKSLKDEGIECGIVLKMGRNDKWSLHLYNVNDDSDFDCGKFLAKKYKGGGHKGAAGAQINLSQLTKLLKTKTL